MATSGTWAFNLDLGDLFEEAFELAGSELRSGFDYHTARRSLNLLLLEWQNRGLNLWTMKSTSQALVAGTASYTLSGEKLDIIEGVCRTNAGQTTQTDQYMRRVSMSNYAQQSNKLTQGKPTQYTVEQSPTALTVYLWPVPDSASYTFQYWYLERVEDAGTSAANTVDVPGRFLPALTLGLAYYLSNKLDDAERRTPILKQQYEEQWQIASEAARERASIFLRPRSSY